MTYAVATKFYIDHPNQVGGFGGTAVYYVNNSMKAAHRDAAMSRLGGIITRKENAHRKACSRTDCHVFVVSMTAEANR